MSFLYRNLGGLPLLFSPYLIYLFLVSSTFSPTLDLGQSPIFGQYLVLVSVVTKTNHRGLPTLVWTSVFWTRLYFV